MLLLLCPRIKELTILGGRASFILELLKTTLSKEYQTAKHPDLVVDSKDESDHALLRMSETPPRRLRLKKTAMLQSLVHFDISADRLPPSNLKFLRMLLDLPSLKHLSLGALRSGSGAAISDLKVDMPCRRLEMLRLKDCRLRTSEVSSIVQCCPNLLEFRMSWGLNLRFYLDEGDPLGKDYCVRFGEIGDAIASHAPKVKVLRIDAEDSTISASCHTPYTISKALQPLEHVEELSLTFGLVYGNDTAGSSRRTLTEVVPKTVIELHISCDLHSDREFGDWSDDEDPWPDWQVADLYQLLQDGSFTQLRFFQLNMRHGVVEESIDEGIIAQHGWVVTASGPWTCKLENRGRP